MIKQNINKRLLLISVLSSAPIFVATTLFIVGYPISFLLNKTTGFLNGIIFLSFIILYYPVYTISTIFFLNENIFNVIYLLNIATVLLSLCTFIYFRKGTVRKLFQNKQVILLLLLLVFLLQVWLIGYENLSPLGDSL